MTFEGVPISSLLSPTSKEDLLAQMLQDLADAGLVSTSWQDGQPELTLANVFSQANSEYEKIVAQAVAGIYFDKAVAAEDKEAVYALASAFFQVTPALATPAVYTATITNDVGVAYPNRAVNSYTVENDDGVVFSNLAEFSLAGTVGATVDVVLTAQTAGATGNTSTALLTPTAALAGTSVSFVLTTPGVDDEDLQQLATRCQNKWATRVQTGAQPTAGYAYLATEADATIRRAKTDNTVTRNSHALDVYIAGESGTIADSSVIQAAQDYIADRQAPTLDIEVKACPTQSQDVTGVVRVTRSLLTDSLKTSVRSAVSDFLRKGLIGGTDIDGSGFIIFSELLSVIENVDSTAIQQIVLSEPLTDVAVGSFNVVIPPDDAFPGLLFEAV